MKRFLEETNFKDFNKFDFTNIQLCQEALKEEKNNLPDEEKKRIKDKKEELNKQYIYAIVDGNPFLTQESWRGSTVWSSSPHPCSRAGALTPRQAS